MRTVLLSHILELVVNFYGTRENQSASLFVHVVGVTGDYVEQALNIALVDDFESSLSHPRHARADNLDGLLARSIVPLLHVYQVVSNAHVLLLVLSPPDQELLLTIVKVQL